MHNSLKRFLTILVFGFCLGTPLTVKADITFPARLEITEVEPGIYDVFFVLPVINGKVLKAKPIFPDAFNFLNEPTVEGDNYTKRMRWRVSCDPEKLAGSKIGIEGLLGSQTDVFFKLSLLNGRLYETKLSPANAYYVIPTPPTFLSLTKDAFVSGIRPTLSIFHLYLLIISLLPFLTSKFLKKLILLFSISSFVGLWLGTNDFLVFSKYHFIFLLVLISLTFAIKLLKQNKPTFKEATGIVFSVLLGIALGAVLSTNVNLVGYTIIDVGTYLLAMTLGILIGLALMVLTLKEFTILLKLIFKKRTETVLGYTIGILAFGILVYEISLYWSVPSMLPSLPLVLMVFVLVTSFILKKLKGFNLFFKLGLFLIPFALGISLGFLDIQIPYALNILLAGIWFLFLSYFYKGFRIKPLLLFTLIIGGVLAGALFAESTRDSLSFALGQTFGYTIILLMFLTSILNYKLKITPEKLHPFKVVLFGAMLLSLGIIWYKAFALSMSQTLQTDFTMGLLHIPILSIVFMLLVWIAWPRHKKIHKAMNLERKKPVISYLFLGFALLLIPMTLKAHNPWYIFKEPTETEIQQITQRILNNTYTAFNLKDETELFTTLSNNLEGPLVDNVYLDSRRRLTMGLKEGAEVTVENVDVSKIGERIPTDDLATVFKYPVEWTVTARVRHLQHIHYRQNKYLGEIALKTIDKVWKISNLTLTSEDRTIISANNK